MQINVPVFGAFGVLYVAIVQYVNFSYVLFLLQLHCCTDCMDNRPGVSAVCRLPVPQRVAYTAFIHCIILPLCQLLNLNGNHL